MNDPIIICPYVCDGDVQTVRAAFHLDKPEGSRLPFFLYKDEELVGPELAYEICWTKFPDRDVIIIHSDMSPMPDDLTNRWYDELLNYARSIPEAGILACNLLYPLKSSDDRWLVQCAGGYFDNGKIAWLGGGVDVDSGQVLDMARIYTDELKMPRRVDWVTFGGIYIRRAVLSSCGQFDRRYRWAYVMDVDYSLEARRHGFELVHVPVDLIHRESWTMKRLQLLTPDNVAVVQQNFREFYKKWSGLFGVMNVDEVS